jgi:lipoate-protein ligase A
LAEIGLPGASQRGVSDLALEDRKIGGACIWRTKGLLHYSTTLLVDPDLDRIVKYLQHPPREPDYRRGRKHRQFLGRIADSLPGADAGTIAHSLQARLQLRRLGL